MIKKVIEIFRKVTIATGISFAVILCYNVCFQQSYDIYVVDQLTDSVLASPNEKQLERLLSYKRYHSVDAAFSLHYHACIWMIYQKYPLLFTRDIRGKYNDTFQKIINHGKDMFSD
ncbi:MAG: hypothetical protein D3925_16215, partial [Candidatus Electrothrix sp. AR5]|nr:hypothetical protein [Candidatus Electrothrix sp. AR5]